MMCYWVLNLPEDVESVLPSHPEKFSVTMGEATAFIRKLEDYFAKRDPGELGEMAAIDRVKAFIALLDLPVSRGNSMLVQYLRDDRKRYPSVHQFGWPWMRSIVP